MAKPRHDYDSPDFYKLIEQLAVNGYTDKEIANELNLSADVFGAMKNGNYWGWNENENKCRGDEFCRVLTHGRTKIIALLRGAYIKGAFGGKKVALGMDFGYSADPTAIVMCGIVDNDLYLDEVCYKTSMLSTDIIKELRRFGDLKVFSDSADPRLIQEIHNGGIKIYSVEKGAGSIIAGIDKMLTMNTFVTERSYNLRKEFRNYVWDKDKDGSYINQPIDDYNHAIDSSRYYCLAMLLGKIQKPKGDIAAAFAR